MCLPARDPWKLGHIMGELRARLCHKPHPYLTPVGPFTRGGFRRDVDKDRGQKIAPWLTRKPL